MAEAGEGAPIPESAEKPINEWGFLDAKREFDKLSKPESPNPEQEARLKEVKGRINKLIEEFEADPTNPLEDIKDELEAFEGRLQILEEMKDSGELKGEHKLEYTKDLQNAITKARGITETEGESPYKGIREFFYTEGLKILRQEVRDLSLGGSGPQRQPAPDLLERIAKATEASAKATRMATGESLEELPTSKEEQRNLIIGLVEQIESNDLPIAPLPDVFTLADRTVVQRISSLVGNESCDPEIRREAVARLRLQHCFAIASSIPGSSKDAAAFLFNVFRQPESKRWGLEGGDFDLFLKEGLRGLDVGRAFELLQNAYTRVANSLGAKNLTPGDIESINKEIEDELGSGKEARTSLKLAYRVAKATLETSVWNKNLSGADPLAEAIYLRRFRTSKLGQVRDRGPDITIDRINGFGTSYLRYAQTLKKIETANGEEKNSYLFLNDKDHHPWFLARLDSAQERISRTLERIRAGLEFNVKDKRLDDTGFDRNFLLNARELDYKSLKPGDYQGWLSIYVTRILMFKSLLLQTTWKPTEDFNSDSIEGFIAPSDMADPEQVLRLRPEHILGVLQAIYSRPNEATGLGWDTVALKGVLDNLTREIEIAEGETKPAYITKDQLAWVIKALKKLAGIDIWHEAAMVSVRRVISTRVK